MQGDMLFIPNTLLLQRPFTNYSAHHSHRFTLKVGVAYSAAPEKVKEAMVRCCQEVVGVAAAPPPGAQVLAFENGFVQYGLFYWVDDYGKHYEVQDRLASRVWEA